MNINGLNTLVKRQIVRRANKSIQNLIELFFKIFIKSHKRKPKSKERYTIFIVKTVIEIVKISFFTHSVNLVQNQSKSYWIERFFSELDVILKFK